MECAAASALWWCAASHLVRGVRCEVQRVAAELGLGLGTGTGVSSGLSVKPPRALHAAEQPAHAALAVVVVVAQSDDGHVQPYELLVPLLVPVAVARDKLGPLPRDTTPLPLGRPDLGDELRQLP